ncbi:DNA-deoxyinosine glycosylase [Brevundimonas subvibrioides]|uniref:Uracil-DNA glycosylase superfamily n=1 Tax=Brevundimonas subvibrioides (strain ATCC 15264 / DSM 4735 / LMG 14903 / NBRC 16000 / CB 81) TaxID=633149 RepID=D9QFR5_BRESC|nr:DNA-deoxyinosine glycosylase [Brevundimonas subvibrioides]ADL00629.1 Uracil-DNA glycosylase superfamily [Brevundimonas subvibrioides ATCC 15264]
MIKRAFPPVVDADTRLLILGSLPGDASLAAQQYYAHPQNAFWRLVGRVVGRDLVALPYPERLEALQAAGIGLWDVIAGGERRGSLDAAIRNAEPADLKALISTLPALRGVAFNGALSARNGRRLLGERADLTLIDLPSSSPAHARPFEQKAAIWDRLAVTLR